MIIFFEFPIVLVLVLLLGIFGMNLVPIILVAAIITALCSIGMLLLFLDDDKAMCVQSVIALIINVLIIVWCYGKMSANETVNLIDIFGAIGNVLNVCLHGLILLCLFILMVAAPIICVVMLVRSIGDGYGATIARWAIGTVLAIGAAALFWYLFFESGGKLITSFL